MLDVVIHMYVCTYVQRIIASSSGVNSLLKKSAIQCETKNTRHDTYTVHYDCYKILEFGMTNSCRAYNGGVRGDIAYLSARYPGKTSEVVNYSLACDGRGLSDC